jgi:homoserine O-acetyltransferase
MPNLISIPDLVLESGKTLPSPVIAYDAWGTLSPRGDNAIIVGHSLTSDTNASSWWPSFIGSGKALDTDRYFVVCLNVLGSPYGSTSPISINPYSGRRYGNEFPHVTIRDTVRAHRQALEALGVRGVALAVGGSMGGMQVLEWSFFGDFVQRIAPVAVGGCHSPWGIAWTEAQRNAIFADPCWNGGAYAPNRPPVKGLAVARMMAMISYRTAGEFNARFQRSRSPFPNEPFLVETYLKHHGERLTGRFDANCYVQLTRQMNSHDVSRGRGEYLQVLSRIEQPTLVVGIASDLLYPLAEQEELARHIPNANLEVIDAITGHDSFLIESEQISALVQSFLLQDTVVTRPL